MHDEEQVLAQEAFAHQALIGGHDSRIGVLHDHGVDRLAALQRLGVAGENRADFGHVEHPRIALLQMRAFDARFIQLPGAGIGMEGAAAAMLPGAGHGRNAQGGVNGGGTVALARKAVAEAEEGFWCLADEMGKGLDFRDGEAGDFRRPFRRAGFKM